MDKQFQGFAQNLKVFGRRAGHQRDYVAHAAGSYERASSVYPSDIRSSAMFIVAANEFVGHADRMRLAVVTANSYSDIYYGRSRNIKDAVKNAAEYYSAEIAEADLDRIVGFISRQICQRTADISKNEAIGTKGLVNVVLNKLR